MAVEVEVPESYMGDVISDLNSRRGKIDNIGTLPNGIQKVQCAVPLSEMFGYATTLRSLTQGRGIYTMEFVRYSIVPKQIFESLVSDSFKGGK